MPTKLMMATPRPTSRNSRCCVAAAVRAATATANPVSISIATIRSTNVGPLIIRYTASRPYVLATNTHAGDLAWLAPPPRTKSRRKASTDAVVGGGAGPSTTAQDLG